MQRTWNEEFLYMIQEQRKLKKAAWEKYNFSNEIINKNVFLEGFNAAEELKYMYMYM
jgi:hypothetical protein